MIPIHELFIGAYVSHNNCNWIVSAIHSPYPNKDKRFSDKYVIELLSDGLINVPIDEIEPITLSNWWLIRFGFEPMRDIEWCLEKGSIMVNTGNHFIVHVHGRVTSVKYVHQLQSLYQSITGKELTLNK